MAGIFNKFTGTPAYDQPSHSTNAGPHDSNLANKMDPLVDSDRGESLLAYSPLA